MLESPYRNHVPVSRRLALPRRYWFAQRVIEAYDKLLRLRKSAERPDLYILERRIRRKPVANSGMRDVSDMHIQARDGYLHVASVHPSFVVKPHRLIYNLLAQGVDLWASGGADKVADELEYEEDWAKITRKRRRLSLFRDIALDHYDLLNRRGNADGTDRTRLSVPAMPAPAGA